MSGSPDYHVDIAALSQDDAAQTDAGPADEGAGRSWIGVHFECCGKYVRVYRSAAGPFYEGRCPQCLRVARVRIGVNGTPERFFRAR